MRVFAPIVVLLCAASAAAQQRGYVPYVPKAPDYSEKVKVDERLGAALPLDTTFTDEAGKTIRLGDLFADELPAVITFNYSNCPKLCSIHLGALTTAIGEQAFAPGRQFRVITIGLDPYETRERMNRTKANYVGTLPESMQASARAGWRFIGGDKQSIDAVADAVGFRYTRNRKTGEYYHAAANVFVSSRGRIVRYLYGLDIEPHVFKESILKAGTEETATSSGFLHRCYSWDPNDNSYSNVGKSTLRIGAAVFVVVLVGAGAGALAWRRIKEKRS